MKYVLVVIMCVFLSSCSIQFKGKDLELDAKPAKPDLEWTMVSVELDPITYLKNGG